MKAKNLSKVLAFLVAAVMIFSALPLMAFATDEATTYTVSFGAPAIPMNVDTKVDLKTLNVEMVKGEAAVSGADITWAADAQEGLILDAVNKTVKVTAVGNYKLTATVDGGTPKNIWVIAKPADQEKIYLVNLPDLYATFKESKSEDWDASDWRFFGNQNDTEYTVPGALAADKMGPINDDFDGVYIREKMGSFNKNAGGTLVYYNDIFKDFADYTVETLCSSYGGGDNGAGVSGRIVLNEAENGFTKGIISYIRGKEQVSAARYTTAGKTEFGGFGTARYAAGTRLWSGQHKKQYTIKNKFEGNEVYFYVNDDLANTLEDGAGDVELGRASTLSGYASGSKPVTNHHDGAGYPGMTCYGQQGRFYSFYVYLNSNDMPATMTDEPVAPAPTADITIVGNGTAKVDAVVGSENTYTVTLDPADGWKVKVGSLVINGKPAVDKDSTDPTGLKYTFTTDDLANTTIAVEYIVDDGKLNTAMLGATIPTNPEVKGIRFGARTDSIKRSTKDATKGSLNNTINVGGEDYTITDIGMILFPTKPLGDAELTVATDGVVRQSVTKIVALTDGYADIAITLTGIPETMLEVQITSRMYVAYTDAKGDTQYVYSNAISKSYDDVVKAIPQ